MYIQDKKVFTAKGKLIPLMARVLRSLLCNIWAMARIRKVSKA